MNPNSTRLLFGLFLLRMRACVTGGGSVMLQRLRVATGTQIEGGGKETK